MNIATLLPDLEPALKAFAASEGVMMIKSSSWVMPAVLVTHVLAITVLGGAMLLPGLRLMGVGMTSVSPASIEKTVRPWLWAALIALAVTGIFMCIVNPMKIYKAPAFLVKAIALIPALLLSLGVVRSLASKDGVMTQQTRVMAIIALVTWLISILIFGTSYGAAPGSFHVVCAGWLIAMVFGSRLTRIALGAITAVIITWMFVMTMLLHSPLDDYDLVMEVDRWTLRATAVIVSAFLLWEFVGKPSPDATTPKLNRMIGVFTILAWITVAAAGRWIGLGGGGL
jgi:hypothetical protein